MLLSWQMLGGRLRCGVPWWDAAAASACSSSLEQLEAVWKGAVCRVREFARAGFIPIAMFLL